MPYARRKTYRKKRAPARRPRARTTRRKKRVSRGIRPMVPRTLGFALQPRRFTKMSWEGSWNITVADSIASYSNIFRLNSIYDPDFGTVTKNTACNGITLAGYLYQKYRVHGAKVTVRFSNMTSYNVMGVVTFSNENDFASSIKPSDMRMRPGACAKMLGVIGSAGRGTVTRYVPINNVIGVTKQEYKGDSANAAYLNANPSTAAYCGVTVGGMPDNYSSYGAAITVMCSIHITYFVELFDLMSNVGSAS